MRRLNKKAVKVLSSAAIVTGVVGFQALAKTVTWAGTVADPNSGTYTANTTPTGRVVEGYTNGANVYIWNTSVANWLGGNYAVGDEVVFTDNFAGGTFIRVASSNMNPSIFRFVDAGAGSTHYNFLANDDLLNGTANFGSNVIFGTNHNTQLILDTGFTGKVTLRAGGAPNGLSTGDSKTIIRSGILEIAQNNALPNVGNNQRPIIELAGGEFRVNYSLVSGDAGSEPATSQIDGTLTVSSNSILSGSRTVTDASNPPTMRIWGNSGGNPVDRGVINVTSGNTLSIKSLTGALLRTGANLTTSTGTILLVDSVSTGSLQTRLQLGAAVTEAAGASWDLGVGTAVLESRDVANTFDLGALYGGSGTTLRGSANGTQAITYSVGARGDSSTFNGKITDGIAADGITPTGSVTSFTKVGTGTLTLTNTNTNTGSLTVSGGTLVLSGANGSSASSATVDVNGGGTLRLDNTTSNSDRIGNAVPLTMNRGAVDFVGNLGAGAPEVIGALSVNGGSNIVRTTATGAGSSASINFASFSRSNGVVSFDLASNVNVNFTTAPTLDDGIIGGYATINGTDWATVSSGNVAAYGGYTTNTAPGTWASTENINLTAGGTSTVAAPTSINSLRMTSGTVSISAGQSLTVVGGGAAQVGGILLPGTSAGTINGGGSLTAGNGAAAAQLIAHVSDAANTLTINTPIADNGATGTVTLVKSGAGKLVLGATNTLTGGLSILQGTVAAGVANIFPGTANLTVDFGNTFDLATFNQTFGTVALIDGSIISTGGAASITAGTYDARKGTVSVGLNGAAALSKTTGDAVTLGAVNGYTGGTTITGGTLTTGVAGALPAGRDVTVNAGNAVLDLGATAQSVGAATLTNGSIIGTGTLTGTSFFADQGTISVNLAGSGGFTKGTANQTVVLTGNNSYLGATTFSGGGGVLEVNTLANGGLNSAIGASGSGSANLTIINGTLRYTGTGANTDRLFNLGGGTATIQHNGTGPLNFTNTGSIDTGFATLTLNGSNADNNTFAPALTGFGVLNKGGGGQWILTGNSSYTGITVVTGGTLTIGTIANGGVNSPLGASTSDAANLVLNGGTLKYTGNGSTNRLFTVGNSGGSIDASGTGPLQFTNTGSHSSVGANALRTLTLTGTNTGNNSIAGVLADAATGSLLAVTKAGTGKWVLNGANTYTGTTTVSGGTLQLGKDAHTPVLSGTTTTGAVVDTALVLDYSGGGTNPSSSVQTILAATYASNSNFTAGVIRSTAASGNRALGWRDSGSAVTILNTLDGDANLDGKVNTLDFNQLAGGFGLPGQVWVNGNFNYDANVDSTDFNLLVGTYGMTIALPSEPLAGASLGAVVPEPASLGVVGLALTALMGRRRR